MLTRLINEIEAIPDKLIIVLDDYHLIDTKSVHDTLNFLVEHLPPIAHLVIVGRIDPPLPISRLRVRGELSEIRTNELRFTELEIAAFLNDLMGFNLNNDDIATLGARTEGWVASLQLAALSMQGRKDRQEFISAFSGSHRYIIDYLVDEVLASQPEDVRAFLRRTSILDRFCTPLCDAVVYGEDVGNTKIVDYLDRSNLFLISLDDHREWYRYHHLFADFLGQRLQEAEPERIPELHRRASGWYESQGLVDEAIQHALAAKDMEAAIRLVDGIAVDLVVRRESNKLLKLVEQLPAGRCQDYPMLCVWHAWALLFMGQLDMVEPILEIVETNREMALGVPVSGYLSTIRAYLANQRGNLQKAIDLSHRALEEMSDMSDQITLIFQGAVVIWLGVNHRLLGDLDTANQFLQEAIILNQKAGNIYGALAAFEQSAELAIIRGQLRRAMDLYRNGLKVAKYWMDKGGNPQGSLVAAVGLDLGIGTVLYQINDLAAATSHLQRGVDLFELGELWGRMHSYRMMAFLKQAKGEFEASSELFGKAFAIKDTLSVRQSNTSDLPSLNQLGILLSRTHPENTYLFRDVVRSVENLGLHSYDNVDFSSPLGYPREIDYADLARVLITQDRAGEALPLLERLLEAARLMGRHGDELRYLVLIALSHHSLGNMPSALDTLSQALTLAEPQGYVRIFVDEGTPMAELLGFAISQDISSDYAKELLTAFPEDVRRAVNFEVELNPVVQTLVEPLSDREINVLRLMAAGHKYKEVAEQLVISLNTVRHHIRNIYSKLNVNNRAQALARAKELELL
jgi:LuxR family maltose regulon positive regulatory protein